MKKFLNNILHYFLYSLLLASFLTKNNYAIIDEENYFLTYFFKSYTPYLFIIALVLLILPRVFKNSTSSKSNLITSYSTLVSQLLFLVLMVLPIINSVRIKYKHNQTIKFESKIIPTDEEGGKVYVDKYFKSNSLPKILLWGDSHSKMANFSSSVKDFNLYKVSKIACPSLLGTVRIDSEDDIARGRSKSCNDLEDDKIVMKVISEISPDVIVVMNRYNLYLNGWRSRGRELSPSHYIDLNHKKENNFDDRADAIKEGILNTIKFIRSINAIPILISQTPDLQHYGSAINLINEGLSDIPISYLNEGFDTLNIIFNDISTENDVKLINANNLYMNNGKLSLIDKLFFTSVFIDDNNLNKISSMRLTDYIIGTIRNELLIGK